MRTKHKALIFILALIGCFIISAISNKIYENKMKEYEEIEIEFDFEAMQNGEMIEVEE